MSTFESIFASENIIKIDDPVLSPTGNFSLTIEHYGKGWSYTRGVIRNITGDFICDVKRNYSSFPYAFIIKTNLEYMICATRYQGVMTVIDLKNGEVVDYHYPEYTYEAVRCFASFEVSSDYNFMITHCCVWGGAYEIYIFDLRDANTNNLPFKYWKLTDDDSPGWSYDTLVSYTTKNLIYTIDKPLKHKHKLMEEESEEDYKDQCNTYIEWTRNFIETHCILNKEEEDSDKERNKVEFAPETFNITLIKDENKFEQVFRIEETDTEIKYVFDYDQISFNEQITYMPESSIDFFKKDKAEQEKRIKKEAEIKEEVINLINDISQTFYVVLPDDKIFHYRKESYQYVDGLNHDSEFDQKLLTGSVTCLQFTTKDFIHTYFSEYYPGPWIYEVKLPSTDSNFKYSYSNHGHHRTNTLILGKCYSMFDDDTYDILQIMKPCDEFLVNHACQIGNVDFLEKWKLSKPIFDLKYNNEAIRLAAKYKQKLVLDWWLNSGLPLKYEKSKPRTYIDEHGQGYTTYPSQVWISEELCERRYSEILEWCLLHLPQFEISDICFERAFQNRDIGILNLLYKHGHEINHGLNTYVKDAINGHDIDILDWIINNINIDKIILTKAHLELLDDPKLSDIKNRFSSKGLLKVNLTIAKG